MTDPIVCRRIIFRGRVQGVGFRMTAARLARGLAIGGTVRNCPDGTVELIVTGAASVVQDFLATLRDAMRGHITGEDEFPGPPGVAVERFQIIG